MPGWDVTSADYQVALSLGKAPLSDKLNAAAHLQAAASRSEGLFGMEQVSRASAATSA